MLDTVTKASRGPGLATRELLVQAAIDCIAEYGCPGATTTRIAERAGVSRGSLQHHFPSRDDLLIAVAERAGVLDQSADVEALLSAPLEDRVDHLISHLERSSLNNGYAAAVRLAAALDKTSDVGKRVYGILAGAVRTNQALRDRLFADIDLGADDWLAIVRTVSAMTHAAAFHLQTPSRARSRPEHDLMRRHQRAMLLNYLETFQRR